MEVHIAEHLVARGDVALSDAAVAVLEDADREIGHDQAAVDGQADPVGGQLEAEAVLVPAGDGHEGAVGRRGEVVGVPQHH